MFSEPTELLAEFREEDEFEKIVREIEKVNAHDAKNKGRAMIKETYGWPMTRRRVGVMGSLPESSGRKGGITSQEKHMAKRQVEALGYGHSRDRILKARSYFKFLTDLGEAGVTLLLLYRTKQSRAHFNPYLHRLRQLKGVPSCVPLRPLSSNGRAAPPQ